MSLHSSHYTPRAKVAETQYLPVLPQVTEKLLDLRDNPEATVQELVEAVALDPILSAHFLKYANSAFFGSQKQIDSLANAINRIGFTIVLNMAIGISTTKSFNIPIEGPIGIREYWRHALLSAHLMRLIASKVPLNQNVNQEIVFLAGLLHNIGFVVLGDQFLEEFTLINNTAQSQSKKSLLELEDLLLGHRHTELGAMLMRYWGLPSEIVISAYEHHNPRYKGKHWQYAALAYLSDYLLDDLNISDNLTDQIPGNLLEALGLSEAMLEDCRDRFASQRAELESMVEILFN